MAWIEELRKSRTLAGLGDDVLERLARRMHEIDVRENQVLIESGQKGSGLFLVCDGTVVVETPGERLELGPGEVVGEIAMVGPGDRRTARVYARTPVRCLAIGRSELEDVLAAEPSLAEALRELAGSRLRLPS